MGKEVDIPKKNELARSVIEKVFISTLYRSEIVNPEKLDKAKELLQDSGLCIIANHFSKKDVQIYQIPFMDPELRKRKITAPYAIHQRKSYIDAICRLAAIEIKYLVTDETIKIAKEKGNPIPKKNEGVSEFMQDAIDTLSERNIVVIFPQGSRREVLTSEDNPNPRTIGTLMAIANKRNVRMGFLFVGIDLAEEVDDYSEVSEYNWRKKYKLTIGNTLSDKQLIAQAGGKLGDVDNVVYKELEGLVSPKYAGVVS